ncbi:hypothetical protein T06_7577 [Trichinella sp. T6]|nr:hypothetical protein T06_7577 [Trichinella sp. T6]
MLILTVSKKKVLANAGSVVLVGVLRGCCLSREGRVVRHWACWHHSEADAAERTQHAYQRKQLRRADREIPSLANKSEAVYFDQGGTPIQ